MKLVLTQSNGRFVHVLPEKRLGRYWIGTARAEHEGEGLLYIEGSDNTWVLKSNKRASVLDGQGKRLNEQTIADRELYHIALSGSGRQATLYAEPETSDRRKYSKYYLPQEPFTLGSSSQSEICFENKYLSGTCLKFHHKNGRLDIQKQSDDLIFLNDKQLLQDTALSPGDRISILDLELIVGADFFAINNPDGLVRLSPSFQAFLPPEVPAHKNEEEIEESQPGELFSRSPRFKREISPPQLKIDSPPEEEKPDDTPLALVLGPSVTMGLASGIMALSSMSGVLNGSTTVGQAAPMMVMSLTMMAGMIIWPLLSRRFEAKRKTKKEYERRERYGKYLDRIDTYLSHEKRTQSEVLKENYVDITECIERIRSRERTLWERAQTHDDFLKVRLGLGDRLLMADIEAEKRTFTLDDDVLQNRLFELAEKPQTLHGVPIVLPLLEQFSVGVIGERTNTTSFMKSLIFQLAALHSYDEAKFLFIYDEDEEDQWGFVRWLPHVWTGDKSMRLVAKTPDEVRRLSSFLSQEALADKDGRQDKPQYIVFALDRKLAAKCDALASIVKSEKYRNVSVIAVYDELSFLPKDSRVVIEVAGEQSRLYDRTNITDMYISFVPDSDLALDAEMLARQLANTRLENAESAFILPQMLAFLEMFNAGKIEHLNARTRWKENNPVLSLQTPVGVGTGGETFVLDLHEKAHGPHGLVAGMTGSGKSEFIMTLILSLAINYHPHELAFVLIDYKGGGMANAFADLPHTVGVITNLEGAAVNRSLISIQSELKRRQAIFNAASKETQVSNIDIYKYQSLYRDGRVSEPLPHLLIISDEFAELKAQQPEFMEQLVSAARIGRSLGVHLILATQKPSGVVDEQIWSNSKFKICLKVQDKSDSMEMIKRSDAAALVEVGRFYLQVGYDELFEIGQSAWAGAPYHPAERVTKEYDDSVVLIDLQGNAVVQVKPSKATIADKDAPKQLDEVSAYIKEISAEEGIESMPLWLPPLSRQIYLTELSEKYAQQAKELATLEAIMGEYDDPANQAQGPMSLSLLSGGNLLLFGATASGKTHFISSFVYSLITRHSASEVNFYLLDFGSETLTSFAPAPQVGDVLISFDAEKTENLFSVLTKELLERRKLFIQYGGDYQSYASQAPNPRPAIVVIINNFSGFKETYPDGEDWINTLTREGVKYGIFFILTAQTPNTVRYTLAQNFGQQMCLSLTDPMEYASVLGRIDNLVPEQNPGRGLYKNDRGVFEFQAALISPELADSPQEVQAYCQELAAANTAKAASPVPCLPAKVTPSFLCADTKNFKKGTLPIAVEKTTLDIVAWDFASTQATLVMSQADEHEVFASALSSMAQTQGYSVLTVTAEALSKADGAPAMNNTDLVIIPSFALLFESLDFEIKENFGKWIEEISANPDVGVVLTSATSDFGSMSYEDWFKASTSLKRGLWLGEGFSDQYNFEATNVSYNQSIGKGFGYTLEAGLLTLVKFLEDGDSYE